jgi:hypothetical protein
MLLFLFPPFPSVYLCVLSGNSKSRTENKGLINLIDFELPIPIDPGIAGARALW